VVADLEALVLVYQCYRLSRPALLFLSGCNRYAEFLELSGQPAAAAVRASLPAPIPAPRAEPSFDGHYRLHLSIYSGLLGMPRNSLSTHTTESLYLRNHTMFLVQASSVNRDLAVI